MHVRSACGRWKIPGQCNACCVAVEFTLGVLHLHMMKLILSFVVFVFNPPTEVAFPFVFTMWQ